jgi:glycine/D-amino acid oxidase-like deaminating enzyme
VTGPVSAASYTPIDGHVDTHRVVAACVARLEEAGAQIKTGAPVVGFRSEPAGIGANRINRVNTAAGDIPCDIVILAGGADTTALAALAGIRAPVRYSFGATVVTSPLEPVFRQVAVIHSPREADLLLNMRQLSDGRMMVHGGRRGGSQDGSLGETPQEVEALMAAAARYLPALAGARVDEVRKGRRPLPADGLPILGFPATVLNLYLAAMHSGVTLAPLVGEWVAVEILDGARIDLLSPYRPERFGQ